MTKLNQESGRSMVEMLGVLAIIGVLSIGGIAGYTMAMNRYRANEVLNAASQLAVIAETMNQGNGGTANLDDIGGTVVGASAIEATRSGTTTTVKITANSTEINSAINSIVGGTNCPTSGNSLECTLYMTGGRLSSSAS